MPPRKRAASAPKAEPEQEPLAPETEDEAAGRQADADSHEPAEETADPTPTDGGGQEPDSAKDEDNAARNDLQAADKPCGECFPNGWPEGIFSVGCTHGTYIREQD
jgi:hypothetical protein